MSREKTIVREAIFCLLNSKRFKDDEIFVSLDAVAKLIIISEYGATYVLHIVPVYRSKNSNGTFRVPTSSRYGEYVLAVNQPTAWFIPCADVSMYKSVALTKKYDEYVIE